MSWHTHTPHAHINQTKQLRTGPITSQRETLSRKKVNDSNQCIYILYWLKIYISQEWTIFPTCPEKKIKQIYSKMYTKLLNSKIWRKCFKHNFKNIVWIVGSIFVCLCLFVWRSTVFRSIFRTNYQNIMNIRGEYTLFH